MGKFKAGVTRYEEELAEKERQENLEKTKIKSSMILLTPQPKLRGFKKQRIVKKYFKIVNFFGK